MVNTGLEGSDAKGFVGGDLIKSEGDPIVTRESQAITAGGSDVELPTGYPFTAAGIPLTNATTGTGETLLIQPVIIPANETRKLALIARGPAAINDDVMVAGIGAADYLGVTWTNAATEAAAVRAVMELLGVVFRIEPTETEIQTQ